MLGHRSKTVPDVVPIQPEFLAMGVKASKYDVDMRMLRVEVGDGRPFE
jgi:hypothetical protein